jgi:hypothetical protein
MLFILFLVYSASNIQYPYYYNDLLELIFCLKASSVYRVNN